MAVEDSEALSDLSLVSSISEAKQLVDTAYLHARKSLKGKLEEKVANPMDFLKYLKDPVGRTRSAVRAADYLETTLKLLKKTLQPCGKQRFNVTDLLDRKQRNMIIKWTGCDYQVRSIKCPKHDTYRTISGECNNRKHSHWGSSNRAFARWLPAEYEDGVSVPRGATNENITQDQKFSLFFMHWSQWVNHDIDLAPASGAGASPELHCETDCAFNPPCFPTKLASMRNPRMLTREKIKAVSSFTDASTVYGSDDSTAKSLRNQTSQLGLLAVNQNFTDVGLELLPFENNMKSLCILTIESTNIPCFKA
ncbi:PREDICTED: LOW QUALITY PROTEIN: myeloperoxidase-like, partial [Apaloderma vittatum]|uniref:LOW QUALITY PROTEIN: myeloperoxidase-like n=1 Tax=Apaloderma vittatum TaxID=57397 RepID=UPI000521554A